MKRWLVMVVILGSAGGVLYYAQRQKTRTPVGPQAIVNAVAETQREISRVPARLTRLSDDDEINIGDGMAQDYLARRRALSASDLALEEYIAGVGTAVSRHARRKLNYKFHYVPESYFVNAFALPGGHIFIGKGLVQLMESEDELASVLGHEVEHVDNYHCNEQELEADRDGTDLAVRSGYSPQGAIDLFQAFAKLKKAPVSEPQSPDQELSQAAIEGIRGYLRSHPLPPEREAQIRKIMTSQHWPQPPETKLRVRPEPVRTAGASKSN
jgi:predicted Zn-dependent protease